MSYWFCGSFDFGLDYELDLFNRDISNWDVSSVRWFNNMFMSNYDFKHDLSNWDISSAEDMDDMFSDAEKF